MRLPVRFSICAMAFSTALAAMGQTPPAERPSAMKLFPEETVVFIRMANAQEFGERLSETSIGRMIRDPQLKGFVDQLYGDVAQIYADKAEDKVGVSWEDLQNLPRGEVAFGVVARPQGRPALILLVEQGEEASVADLFVERALDLAEERGAEIATETISGVEVTIVRDADRPNRMVGIFERDNTIVAATDANVLRGLLWHWDGGEAREGASEAAAAEDARSEIEESDAANSDSDEADAGEDEEQAEEAEFVPGRTLAENERFATILQQCRRPQDPPPHLLFFVDPIEAVRHIGRDQGGVQFVMGLLPALGLDGLLGLGGTVTYSTEKYDDLTHLHLLLENPRAGVMQLPAFEAGDTTPQPFVPVALESYVTWQWNARTTYDRVVALVDKFRYEGSVDKIVKERLSDPLGIDFPTAVLDNLAGRFTWIIGYDTPARLQNRQHVLAAELKDEAAAIESLKTVMDKYPDLFEERQFGSVTYYAILPEDLKEMDEEDRPAQPFVAVMDGYIFLGGSMQLFERCVAARDATVDRLIDSEDYTRIRDVLGSETAGATPALLSVSRAEESVRHWYEALASEKTRGLIDEHKEGNQFLTSLAEALEEHELPPFEVLAPYFAPGGAILYDTDNGYHAISFTLQNDTEPTN